MLSTQPIKNVNQASHYFLGRDNYYTEEQTLAKERSGWWGKGSQTLGLSGAIDSELFNQLLRGKLPTGQQLGKVEDDIVKHRPGFDLTFSVPKSVSMLALLGGDERIFAAVKQATDKALTMIERDLAKARVTKDGITDYQKTGNLVVAKFLHDLSREGDPQLHTHCVVMNMTQRHDGQWRSLASQIGDYSANAKTTPDGFFEAAQHHKKYYGAVFRAELAYEMTRLGYTPVKTHQGFFEIAGISPEAIKVYSQRRRDIEAYLKENNLTGAKEAAMATLKTRNAKQIVDRETLDARWRAKESLHGINAFEEAKQTVELALHPEIPSTERAHHQQFIPTNSIAKQAVLDAIAHLSESRVALRENELIQQAVHHVIGEQIPVSAILQAIETIKAEGSLIPLPTAPDYRGDTYFTTTTLLRYEQELLQMATQPHPSNKPLVASVHLDAYLAAHSDLTGEQQQALRTLFSSHNQTLILAGTTGSGKTHLLKNMCELAEMSGYKPIVLTSGKAQSLDIKAQMKTTPTTLRTWVQALFDRKQFETVAGFLYRQENKQPLEDWLQKKPLVIVENATLLSSKQLRDVMRHTERLGGRMLPIGDPQSVLTWQAGSPLTQMLKHGVTCAHLSENLRSRMEPLKAAIADTLQGQLQAAFDKVGQRIFSITDKAERQEVMAGHYANLPAAERKTACVLMPNKSTCDEMNLAIRTKFKDSGEIAAGDQTANVLLPHGMTSIEQQLAKNYHEGQWVRFHADYRSLGVQHGDYRRITGIDAERNTVKLTDAKGKIKSWNPQQVAVGKVEVFDAKTREVAAGDVLAWQRNDKQHNLYNGERVTVAGITEKKLHLLRDNGKALHLDRRNPESAHFDYGYAFTPLQKYHSNPDTVIAYQSSFSRQSHQRAFYKLIGQAKQQAWIYTEDKSRLLTQLQQHSGDKTTAIDALLYPETQPPTAQASEHIRLLEQAVQNAITRLQQAPTPEAIAKEAVLYALAHLSEREAAFSHKEVMEVSLRHALGSVGTTHIEQAVKQAEQNGELLRGLYSTDGTRWTMQAALQMERDIIALARGDSGQLPPLVPADSVERYLEQAKPSAEQTAVLRGLLAQTDRVTLLQGFAGTGKTTLLKHVQAVLAPQPQELLCLAPTHQAVKELKARGLEGQTLASFLTQYRANKLDLPKDKLVIAVDESSMVSNGGLYDFLRAIIHLNAYAQVIGDTKQYASIESGKPFDLLQQAGVKTLFLKDITRQKNPTLKQAVQTIYRGEFAQSFKILEKSIVEIPNELPPDDAALAKERPVGAPGGEPAAESPLGRYKRLAAICDQYMAKEPAQRAQTLIVTFGNADRVEQNAIIRDRLKAEGELHGEPLVTQIMVARKLTETERTRVGNYQQGDVVRFNLADKSVGIEKDQYLTVDEIHSQQNVLVLRRQDGARIAWKPHHFTAQERVGVEVYQAEEREIQAGDIIRWTRTDKTLGLLSPELARVDQVQDKVVSVQPITFTEKGMEAQGSAVVLSPTEARFQHWDHAYAMTGYSAQGKTIKEVIINAESYRPQLTSQPSILVAITRAVETLTLYTDNKQALLEAILNNPGDKSSALEVMGEFPYAGNGSQKTPLQPVTAKNQRKPELHPQTLVPPTTSTPAEPSPDAQRINQMLVAETEAVVERLLGEPKVKTGRGGNLLSLIAEHRGLDLKRDFKQVLREAIQIIGTTETDLQLKNPLTKTLAPPKSPKALTPQQQKSLRYARQLAQESQPLAGTLAEHYLREHRGIQLTSFPDSMRFHPAVYSKLNGQVNPALLVIAKDSEKKIQAVQAIFLDSHTGKKAGCKVKKQTFGMPSKGSVQIESKPAKDAPTFLAEGPETGLSIYAALGGGDVRITLGKSNFGNLDPQHIGRHVVLCLDNDGNNPQTETLTHVVAEKLQAQGKTVWVAQPKEIKNDYNDVLIKQGATAVAREMEQAVPYQQFREQQPSDITLKSAVLDKNLLRQEPSKIAESPIKVQAKNEAIQTLIKSDFARDLLERMYKPHHKSIRTFASPSLEPLKPANKLPEKVRIKPIEKEREPEL